MPSITESQTKSWKTLGQIIIKLSFECEYYFSNFVFEEAVKKGIGFEIIAA